MAWTPRDHNMIQITTYIQGGICRKGQGGPVLVNEFRGMAVKGLFCADMLRPLKIVPLTDFTHKYHPAYIYGFFCSLCATFRQIL